MAPHCISDGGADPAGVDQLSTAAVLPDGDHRAETHREGSGGRTTGPAPNGTQQTDQT